MGGDWSHAGIAEFYNAVQENGYQFIYLSARAIGQSQITRNLLRNVKQSNQQLPSGPLLVSPDTLMAAFYRFVTKQNKRERERKRKTLLFSREVIAKKPEDFKIECLKNIASLFPGKNPFYAGFGNRINVKFHFSYSLVFSFSCFNSGSMVIYSCRYTGDTNLYDKSTR